MFTRQVRKQLAQYIEIVSVREIKTLARLASRFLFLLANPEFYSHLASWQVSGYPHPCIHVASSSLYFPVVMSGARVLHFSKACRNKATRMMKHKKVNFLKV
jgi:hypothetical protein